MIFRQLTFDDLSLLVEYLGKLSDETLKRFGPHPFDIESIERVYTEGNLGFIAVENEEIIAYAVVHQGIIDHEKPRLSTYGIDENEPGSCTIAPSVADSLQGKGVGTGFMKYVLNELKEKGFRKVNLWGGVQADNEKAVRLYTRLGFNYLGEFEYYGKNLDMVLSL